MTPLDKQHPCYARILKAKNAAVRALEEMRKAHAECCKDNRSISERVLADSLFREINTAMQSAEGINCIAFAFEND